MTLQGLGNQVDSAKGPRKEYLFKQEKNLIIEVFFLLEKLNVTQCPGDGIEPVCQVVLMKGLRPS